MNQRNIVFVALVLATCTVVLEATKIKTQKDPKFDFATISTWNWSPAGPGDVKIWVSKDSKSEPVKKQWEPVLMQAVEDQFTARGYTRATTAPPDFIVTYLVLVGVGSSSQYMGQFMPTNYQWGITAFAPQTTSMEVYPQGTLLIDAATPAKASGIWRGMAEARVELEITEAKRTARLQTIIKDLLSKFPKKQKK